MGVPVCPGWETAGCLGPSQLWKMKIQLAIKDGSRGSPPPGAVFLTTSPLFSFLQNRIYIHKYIYMLVTDVFQNQEFKFEFEFEDENIL